MLKKWAILCSVVLLTGCASNLITEFGDRSLAYGWLDITEVDANRLHGVTVYQFRPQTSTPYYHAAVKKFKNGFLYFTSVLPNGSHKTISAYGQQCLAVICTNTRYEYSFGKQGDAVGAVVIKSPGVYSLGSYKLKEVKTRFFEQGKFEVLPAKNAPSKREMLEEILKEVEDLPVVAERVRREIAKL